MKDAVMNKENKPEKFKEASFVKNQVATCQHFFMYIGPKMILSRFTGHKGSLLNAKLRQFSKIFQF